MNSFLKLFLIVGGMVFFVACEDVNTLCINDGKDTNESVDNNDTNDTVDDNKSRDDISYRVHRDIKSSLFYVGENNTTSSAWDADWLANYGDKDAPNENPYYVALPYNDLDDGGLRKKEASSIIPWATSNDPIDSSICKNRWVKITVGSKDAYAQWEDVKPSSDDGDYVFGSQKPSDSKSAGIFLSPAVRSYLAIGDNSSVDWQFVEYSSVPSGAWKIIETK